MTHATTGPLSNDPPRTIRGQLDDVVKEMRGLKDEAKLLRGRQNRLKYGVLGIVFTLVIDLALSGLVIFLFDRENSTRQKVLCPLYTQILASYNPVGPSAINHPGGRQGYQQAFSELRVATDELRCEEKKSP